MKSNRDEFKPKLRHIWELIECLRTLLIDANLEIKIQLLRFQLCYSIAEIQTRNGHGYGACIGLFFAVFGHICCSHIAHAGSTQIS